MFRLDLSQIDGTADQRTALDLFARSICRYHDSGDSASAKSPLARLAIFLSRIGRHEPAATLAGYADNAFSQSTNPELTRVTTHLRGVLGPDRHTALTELGRVMAPADAVRYALEQIDLALAVL